MSGTKKPKISEHIRQRTREWFRKAEHELAYLRIAPFDLEEKDIPAHALPPLYTIPIVEGNQQRKS